eukprot:scaffold1828_cov169-Amphora_coffeaeformis.AAC.25
MIPVGLFLCLISTSPLPQQWSQRVVGIKTNESSESPKQVHEKVTGYHNQQNLPSQVDALPQPTSAPTKEESFQQAESLVDSEGGFPALSLEPLDAFNRWKAQHSTQTLREETPSDRKTRKFLLGQFSCPRQAGNLVHDFNTALLMAIVTNRTLVWDYYNYHPAWNLDNQRENCDLILHMKDWVPVYDTWRDVYNLTEPAFRVKGVEKGGWNLTNLRERFTSGEDRLVPLNISRFHDSLQLIVLGKLRGLTSNYDLWAGLVSLQDNFSYSFISQLLGFENNPRALDIIPHLYQEGVAFLYGMLFRKAFGFSPVFMKSVESYLQPINSNETFTIGIHSRHPRAEDDGSNVQREASCLNKLLDELGHARSSSNCTVFVMADRPATIVALQNEAHKQGCHDVVVEDLNLPVADGNGEHGPRAKDGFFRDLLVVSQARTAFVGFSRSSSALVYELMVFDGRREGSILPPLHCDLGYNRRMSEGCPKHEGE